MHENINLCTVANDTFLPNASNLIKSFFNFLPNSTVYLYTFGEKEPTDLAKKLPEGNIVITHIPKVCDYIYHPRVFFYKSYALKDCMEKCEGIMVYSDSTHCFLKDPTLITSDLIDDCLFLPYQHPSLRNKFWTTKQCFKEMSAEEAIDKPQYWAGFQSYRKTSKTISFVESIYNFMLNPLVALPPSLIRHPDGAHNPCIEHRQEQSVLSLLIDKESLHQPFSVQKNAKYGDWPTIQAFDPLYGYDESLMVLSPRESKRGIFRYN